MPLNRVALIFDDRLRPDTTGVYVRRALAGLAEVAHFQPDQARETPGSGFNLYLSVDDDTEHRLPDALRPHAYWAIDTHRDFPARFRRAVSCDLVFAAQRDGAERLRGAGIESPVWLPLACDPEVHRRQYGPEHLDKPHLAGGTPALPGVRRPQHAAKQFDVSFVGHFCPGPRNELLELIRRSFPNHFIGQAYFGEMARIYSASRIVFNRSIKNDVNMRVFEALACGSLLITNDLAENGQAELFQNGVHLVTYREPEEAIEKIRYYLAHEAEREKNAAVGRAEALAHHTNRHRMERLLAEAERVAGCGVSRVRAHRRSGTRAMRSRACRDTKLSDRLARRAGRHPDAVAPRACPDWRPSSCRVSTRSSSPGCACRHWCGTCGRRGN